MTVEMNGAEIGCVLADVVSAANGGRVQQHTLIAHRDALAERAIQHRVPGPVFAAYTERGLDPGPLLTASQVDAGMSRVTALHDLEFMAEVFAAAGIDFLVFKGQVLTTLVGGDEWERPTLDLDVLIRGADLESAVDRLVSAGAVHLDRNWELMENLLIGEVHLVLPAGTALDLHWHLVVRSSTRTGFSPDHESIFERSRTVDLDGAPVPTFGAADTLVYSCLHAVISGGHRLVWIKDVEQLVLHDRLDWDDVVATATQWRCGLVVGAMLMRSQSQLGLAIPHEVIESLVPGRLTRRSMMAVDRMRPVRNVAGDDALLRMLTRSVDVNARSSLRSFTTRGVTNVVRRALRRPKPTAADLLVDHGSLPAHRARYFAAVRRASAPTA